MFLKYIFFFNFLHIIIKACTHTRIYTFSFFFFLKNSDINVLDTSDVSEICILDTLHQSATHELNNKLRESLQSSNSVQSFETSSNSSSDPLSISNVEQNIAKPLLDKSKIGNKQRYNTKTSIEIENMVSN